MFLKFFILVALIASSGCAIQRQRFGSRQSSAGTSTGSRQRPRGCSVPKLINGIVTPLFKGRMMRFDCKKGYSRLGERYAECQSGRWSIYTFPICIKAGCPIITTPDNGKISYLNSKASAMLFCEPNYEAVGSSFAHCNGSHWDRTIGTCKETDNAPPMSCDFESENLCGWVHDVDHEVDFERRSGYNNKSVVMATGPHADHTTGIPFQGHYMVMNTNTEISTKRARLISPLFRVNATTICFSFYYHMYGIGVGTLRVYMKPETVDMADILRDETEQGVNNEFVVSEISGSKGNIWLEGGNILKATNESFQIIIEAVSGYTRNSDIAFDDVSIFTDEDCAESDDDRKEQENVEDEDGVLTVESCVNRCFEDKNSTVQLSANHTLSCSCSLDCDPKLSCCTDFLDVCMKDVTTGLSTQMVTTAGISASPQSSTTRTSTNSTSKISVGKSTTISTVPLTTTSIQRKTITSKTTSTTKSTTTSTAPPTTTSTAPPTTTSTAPPTTTSTAPPTTTSTAPPTTTSTVSLKTPPTAATSKLSSSSATRVKFITPSTTRVRVVTSSTTPGAIPPTKTMSTLPQSTSTFNQTRENETKATDTLRDYAEVADEHEVSDEPDFLPNGSNESDNFVNERYMMKATTNNDTFDMSFIIKAFSIAIFSVFLSFVVFVIVYHQYKKSTNPLNYKEKNENGSKKVNEEFSEIRYLTSDETLDFNLLTCDTATEL